MSSILRVHAISHNSIVNGPGRRTVIHTQGCTLACPGCFNPFTHPAAGGTPYTVDALVGLVRQAAPDGVTFSGGEPTQQLEPLTELARALRADGLSLLMFSGYTLEELRSRDGGPTLLELLDVLIDGRYEQGQPTVEGLRGSANQRIHLLSRRHTPDELALREVEVAIDPQGQVRISGFPDPALAQHLRRRLEG